MRSGKRMIIKLLSTCLFVIGILIAFALIAPSPEETRKVNECVNKGGEMVRHSFAGSDFRCNK